MTNPERRQTWYNRIFCAIGWHWPRKMLWKCGRQWFTNEELTQRQKDGYCGCLSLHPMRRRCDSCEQWLSK